MLVPASVRCAQAPRDKTNRMLTRADIIRYLPSRSRSITRKPLMTREHATRQGAQRGTSGCGAAFRVDHVPVVGYHPEMAIRAVSVLILVSISACGGSSASGGSAQAGDGSSVSRDGLTVQPPSGWTFVEP